MLAAELYGSNGQGFRPARRICPRGTRRPQSVRELLGPVLPFQVENPTTEGARRGDKTVDEVRHELEERGISLDLMKRILDPEQVE